MLSKVWRTSDGISGCRGESPLMNSLATWSTRRGISAFRPALKSYSSVEEVYFFIFSPRVAEQKSVVCWLVRASVRDGSKGIIRHCSALAKLIVNSCRVAKQCLRFPRAASLESFRWRNVTIYYCLGDIVEATSLPSTNYALVVERELIAAS